MQQVSRYLAQFGAITDNVKWVLYVSLNEVNLNTKGSFNSKPISNRNSTIFDDLNTLRIF